MKTYLDACGVPTTTLGAIEIPRLIMGIHPYDGCSYQDSRRDAENLRQFDRAGEVAAIIRHAAEEEGVTAVQVDHMAPELNRLHLQAVWEASREADIEIGLIAYILVPITLNGEMVSYSKRAHSTFYTAKSWVEIPSRNISGRMRSSVTSWVARLTG